jgi:hypothetical protein
MPFTPLVALAWLFTRRASATVISGSQIHERLADNPAGEPELSADEWARVEDICHPPLVYP